METAANGLVHLTSSLAATLLVLSATAGQAKVALGLSTQTHMDLGDLSAAAVMGAHLDRHAVPATVSGGTDNTCQDPRISGRSATSLAGRAILTKEVRLRLDILGSWNLKAER